MKLACSLEISRVLNHYTVRNPKAGHHLTNNPRESLKTYSRASCHTGRDVTLAPLRTSDRKVKSRARSTVGFGICWNVNTMRGLLVAVIIHKFAEHSYFLRYYVTVFFRVCEISANLEAQLKEVALLMCQFQPHRKTVRHILQDETTRLSRNVGHQSSSKAVPYSKIMQTYFLALHDTT